jgi:hypothetical protein
MRRTADGESAQYQPSPLVSLDDVEELVAGWASARGSVV